MQNDVAVLLGLTVLLVAAGTISVATSASPTPEATNTTTNTTTVPTDTHLSTKSPTAQALETRISGPARADAYDTFGGLAIELRTNTTDIGIPENPSFANMSKANTTLTLLIYFDIFWSLDYESLNGSHPLTDHPITEPVTITAVHDPVNDSEPVHEPIARWRISKSLIEDLTAEEDTNMTGEEVWSRIRGSRVNLTSTPDAGGDAGD